MPTQLLKRRAPQETLELLHDSASDPITGVARLAQELIRQVTLHQSSSPPHDANDEEDVILDIEVDGVRCLLIRTQPGMPASSVTLSPREQEIVRMIAKGYPNKTIAAVLDISAWTVCTHIRRVFAKLGVGSRAAMVAKLLEDGSIASITANLVQPSVKHSR